MSTRSCRQAPRRPRAGRRLWLAGFAAAMLVACQDGNVQSSEGGRSLAGLRYEEAVSGGARSSDVLPIVLVLHGRGDRPRPEGFVQRPERARWLLPYAPTRLGDGYSWFAYERADDPELAGRVGARAATLQRFIHEALARYPSTAPRVVVLGVSQGGMLAFALAAQHHDLVRAAVPVMGMLPEALRPRGTHPVLVRAVHGTDDSVVPYAAGRMAVESLREQGYDVSLETIEGGTHQVDAAVQAALQRALADVL